MRVHNGVLSLPTVLGGCRDTVPGVWRLLLGAKKGSNLRTSWSCRYCILTLLVAVFGSLLVGRGYIPLSLAPLDLIRIEAS